jgi:plastocyanin
MNQNQSFSFTASTAGTFTYFCRFHPFMKATLVVSP